MTRRGVVSVSVVQRSGWVHPTSECEPHNVFFGSSFRSHQLSMDGYLAFFSMLVTRQSLGRQAPATLRRDACGKASDWPPIEAPPTFASCSERRAASAPDAEGETYLVEGARVLQELEALETVTEARPFPRGLLRVCATLGFGRRHIAPALSKARRIRRGAVAAHRSARRTSWIRASTCRSASANCPTPELAWPAAGAQPARCAPAGTWKRAGEPASPKVSAMPACSSARATRPRQLAPSARQRPDINQGPQASASMIARARSAGARRPRHPDALDREAAMMRGSGAEARAAGVESALGADLCRPVAQSCRRKTRALVDFLLSVPSRIGSTKTATEARRSGSLVHGF